MDGGLAVEERHAGAHVFDDTSSVPVRERLLVPLEERAQVAPGHQLHDEHEPIAAARDGAEDVDRVRAPEARHRLELPHEGLPLVAHRLRRCSVRLAWTIDRSRVGVCVGGGVERDPRASGPLASIAPHEPEPDAAVSFRHVGLAAAVFSVDRDSRHRP